VRFSAGETFIDVTMTNDNTTTRDFLSMLTLILSSTSSTAENTAGIGFSDDVIHLGSFDATPDQLTNLEGRDVTAAVL